MSMIKQVDGGYLLQALRAGRQDRMAQQEWEAKQAAAQQAAERQQRVDGLIGQYLGGGAPQQPQGVQAAMEPPMQDAPAGGAFEQPVSMGGFGDVSGAPAMPEAAPAMTAPPRQYREDILRQLVVLDPETGGKIVSALKSLDETSLKRLETKNASMGAAAQTLMNVPAAQREQMFRTIAPQLLEAGWTGEELARADMSDQGLQMYVGQAMDTDAIIDNELAEREFMAGKVTPVTADGMLIRTMPDGSSQIIAAPEGYMGGGAGGGDIPSVNSPDEALRLPPGAQFRMPDGRIGTVPGGAGSNAGGGFPVKITESAGFRGIPGEQVTSTYRNPAKNKAVGGVANSYHTRRGADGQALARDSVPPPGMSMTEYHRRLVALNPGMDVINEGDHIHIEPRG